MTQDPMSSFSLPGSISTANPQGLPPGPAALPVIGGHINLLRFMSDPVRFMTRMRGRYGNTVALNHGRSSYVFAFGPDNNRHVLGDVDLFHNLDASSLPFPVPPRSSLSRLFSGLIQMNGHRHAQQRQLLAPAFAKRMSSSYFASVADATTAHLANWHAGDRRDMAREMNDLTLSIAARLLLGITTRSNDDIVGLFQKWTKLVFSPATLMLPFDLPGLKYRALLNASDLLEREIRSIIRYKRLQDGGVACALSALMQAQARSPAVLNDDELVGHTNFLFMAGHATTANALTWTLFLLDRHPHILNAVRDECDTHFGKALPAPETLQQLTLLDFVVKEAIRLLPPVIWWCKVGTAPFELGPYRFSAETRVIQSAYITHRDPKLYPEPAAFKPERWAAIKPDSYAYCPFSAGARVCLGSMLAQMEIKLIIALILARFSPRLPAGSRVVAHGPMILAPKHGLQMRLDPRDATAPVLPMRGNMHTLIDLPGRDGTF
jgi:cytochrome P450